MAVSSVGTPASATTTSGTGSVSVTGTWGTGLSRTAGNFLVACVTCFGSTSSTVPATPSGWTLQKSQQDTNSTHLVSVGIYTKVAAGGDAAPAFTSTISGTSADTLLTCALLELTGQNATPVPSGGTGGAGTTTGSPLAAATTAIVPDSGCYGISVLGVGQSSATTQPMGSASGWTALFGNGGTSTFGHYLDDVIAAPASGSTLSQSHTIASSHTGAALAVLLVQDAPTAAGPVATSIFTRQAVKRAAYF